MVYGTAHFVSERAAIRYYRDYGYGAEQVRIKIRESEIHIGRPELPQGAKLLVIDNGTRYAIEEPDIPKTRSFNPSARAFDNPLGEV